jgi:hypothetical protein
MKKLSSYWELAASAVTIASLIVSLALAVNNAVFNITHPAVAAFKLNGGR